MADPEKTFLGTGWSFPPTFTRLGLRVEMVSAENDIRESLFVLFSTAPGERIMVPQYGCQLDQYVFQAVTTTWATQLKATVSQAILNWEPRIDVTNITVDISASADGLVKIGVDYAIRGTNSRSNFVYPFYLREATLSQGT